MGRKLTEHEHSSEIETLLMTALKLADNGGLCLTAAYVSQAIDCLAFDREREENVGVQPIVRNSAADVSAHL